MALEMSRRNFLKAGAAATAVAGSAATALASETTPAATDGKDVLTRETLEKGTWSFMIAPEPVPEDQIKETKTHDIVVVGAGMAGLCCAVSAAEQGADVIVFSASSKPISRGGSNHAIGSKYQAEHGIVDSLEPAYVDVDGILSSPAASPTRPWSWPPATSPRTST